MGDWVSLTVFLGTSVVILLASVLLNRDNLRIAARVRQLSDTDSDPGTGALGEEQPASTPELPPAEPQGLKARLLAFGNAVLGTNQPEQARLKQRFTTAGIYNPNSPSIYLGVKMLLLGVGLALGLSLGLVSLVAPSRALLAGVVLAGLGVLLPGLWLDARVSRWQSALRRGLPDAMDMLVLCMEGGVSLSGALRYITAELRTAHPGLGNELEVVQHEILLGKTPGEAVQKFGQRCDLEEVRTLAAVLLQNERFGVSVARALRIHSDCMRQQRQQRAEEMAQKAAVKILFPTLLCIFPAIFIVILGPAAFRIMAVFNQMK